MSRLRPANCNVGLGLEFYGWYETLPTANHYTNGKKMLLGLEKATTHKGSVNRKLIVTLTLLSQEDLGRPPEQLFPNSCGELSVQARNAGRKGNGT